MLCVLFSSDVLNTLFRNTERFNNMGNTLIIPMGVLPREENACSLQLMFDVLLQYALLTLLKRWRNGLPSNIFLESITPTRRCSSELLAAKIGIPLD